MADKVEEHIEHLGLDVDRHALPAELEYLLVQLEGTEAKDHRARA